MPGLRRPWLGQRLAGRPSDKARLPPGDLFVVIQTVDDLRFERRGCDLCRVESIEVVCRNSVATHAGSLCAAASSHSPTADRPAASLVRAIECGKR